MINIENLTLMPVVMLDEATGYCYSQTTLPLGGQSLLLAKIKDIEVTQVPCLFNSYFGEGDNGGKHYGNTAKNGYGRPLECVTAGQLCALFVGGAENHYNRPAWAYLRELKPETLVALYWH